MTTAAAGPGAPRPPAAQPQGNALVPRVEPSALAQVTETSTAMAAQLARTAIEARFTVALGRPRNPALVQERIFAACKRPKFASEARYAVPRAGKEIDGLSVRFAEEAMRAMGNLIVESRVVFDDTERRIISVSVTDLEANVTWPTEVVVEKFVERKRPQDGRETISWRNNSNNERVYKLTATDDEVMQKQGILVSKAARNGILRFLPSDVQEEALAMVKNTLYNASKTDSRNADVLARLAQAFAALGVMQEHLEGYLGHAFDKVTPEEYQQLRGMYEALKDGEVTWDEIAASAPAVQRRAPTPVKQADDYGAAPQPVKTTVVDMAERPGTKSRWRRVQTDAAPDAYHCDHGVPLTQDCQECEAMTAGGSGYE